MKDQKLLPGCHRYPYNYRITAPNDEWAAEIFLVNPNGRGLASNAIDVDRNEASGTLNWKICRRSTPPGTFTIKMKVTYNVGREIRDGFVRPDKVRLSYAGRR